LEYTVEPSEDGQFVVVAVTGDITRTEATEVTLAMYELGTRHGITRYLLDMRKARNRDRPVVNLHFTLEDLPAVPGVDLRKQTIALLVDPSDHSHDFFAAFAQSQGISTTLFWEYSEAVDYLRQAGERDHGPQPG